MKERAVPWNQNAEQALLGAMLVAPGTIAVAADVLTSADFYKPSDGIIFDTIVSMWLDDETSVDTVTVSGKLPDQREYIHTLAEVCPAASNIRWYADMVKHDSTARALIKAGQEIAELGYAEEEETSKLIDCAESRLSSIRPDAYKSTHKMNVLSAEVLTAIQNGEKPRMISTGFRTIDQYAKGLFGGNLIIVGARPGIGKTALGLAVAKRVSESGTVAFFSLEMRASELMERLLASEACVSLTKIRERSTTGDEMAALIRAQAKLEQCDLRFVDDSTVTMLQLCSRVRQMAKTSDLQLVVVDYLQLMSMGSRTENRREEVSEMSRKLKSLALEVDVPIIALSQLNRVSTFDGTKVDISQLKESGSLEQDADMVWLMSWPKEDTYGQKSVIIDVAKHRNGPIGEAELIWVPQYMRYEE